MTIEQKAKAYDKLLGKAKQIYNKENDVLIIHTLEDLFPELKESEDERIRKELIKVFSNREKYLIDQSFGDITVSEILTWLEKQGETVWSEETDDDAWLNDIISKVESGCTLNSSEIKWLKSIKDKINIHYWTEEEIEPIISDYLRGAEHYGGMIGRLRCLKPKSLEKQRTSYTKSDVDDAYLKGISDAKNELEKQGEKSLTVDIESMIEAYEQRLINQGNGVRNSPIVNMCVAAFKHGVENTLDELHLKQGETSSILSNSSNIGKDEQKPAWSEEDKKEYKYVLKFVDNILNNCGNKKDYDHCKRCYDWLKSLKERIGG